MIVVVMMTVSQYDGDMVMLVVEVVIGDRNYDNDDGGEEGLL